MCERKRRHATTAASHTAATHNIFVLYTEKKNKLRLTDREVGGRRGKTASLAWPGFGRSPFCLRGVLVENWFGRTRSVPGFCAGRKGRNRGTGLAGLLNN